MSSVFVSHSSTDVALARALVQHLEARGIPCWLADRDVDASDDYTRQIIRAIDTCPAFVALISETAESSPHVRREIERATGSQRPIIPVRLDGVIVGETSSYLLAGSQWIEMSSASPAMAFTEVERIIHGGPTGLERRPPVPFHQVLSSRTSNVGVKVTHPLATIALVCSFTVILSPVAVILGLLYLLTPGHRPEGRLAAGSAVVIGLGGTIVLVAIISALIASGSS